MGEKMTLADALSKAHPYTVMHGKSGQYPDGSGWGHAWNEEGMWLPREAWSVIRAHLTQPAQAVDGWQPTDDDVQAWRGRHNISLSLYDCRSAIEDARIMHHFDVRPAALPNANGKEG